MIGLGVLVGVVGGLSVGGRVVGRCWCVCMWPKVLDVGAVKVAIAGVLARFLIGGLLTIQ